MRVSQNGGAARDPDAVARFVEEFALLLNESGIPRMPARTLAALMVDDRGRLTAAQLAEQLGVSPAAISGAVRYLMQVQLIVRKREPGDKRDHYSLLDDPWYEAIMSRDKELVRWQSMLEEGARAAGVDTSAGRRLSQARRFFAFVHAELPGLMDRWRAQEQRG
ncbi:MarR family protein [Labedaea rhizosphaerae]|uniref:MarR family protein n=1 Tax=Labedaea rhizosphaerae TaxID=598644 RepID=A0A4R6SLZ5_LABRH|nr:MarR family protein [Labedaea rhizosphaerae]